MGELPRERYGRLTMRRWPILDEAVPLTDAGGGARRRWLMAPRAFAKLLQLAEIGEEDRVLDVGPRTGYSAAVLGKIAKTVVALECDGRSPRQARKNLAGLSLDNVRVVEGPLTDGWVDEGPYDAIVLGGSVTETLAILLDQLKDGGRLVGVMRQSGLGKGVIWRRLGRSARSVDRIRCARPRCCRGSKPRRTSRCKGPAGAKSAGGRVRGVISGPI